MDTVRTAPDGTARHRPETHGLRSGFGYVPLPRPRESAGVSGRVAGSGRKVSATADQVAVGAVRSEPVSGDKFPDLQGISGRRSGALPRQRSPDSVTGSPAMRVWCITRGTQGS